MRSSIPFVLLLLFTELAFFAQTREPRQGLTAAALPTSQLLSEPGATFRVDDDRLTSHVSVITYGDQRFTDPKNIKSTNPRVRQWLVNQIVAAHPAAVILNGDVPLAGDVPNDYAVFQAETRPWRDAGLHVFPALGNHEFHGDARQCLENWWDNFPEMRNRRWYAAQLGSRVYVLALDSDTSLLPGSDQARWIERQIDALPSSIDFVILAMPILRWPISKSTSRSTTTHGRMKLLSETISRRWQKIRTRVFSSARDTSTITNAICIRGSCTWSRVEEGEAVLRRAHGRGSLQECALS